MSGPLLAVVEPGFEVPTRERLRRLAAACPARGDVGVLDTTLCPDSGRVMIPAALLAELVEASGE